MRPSRQAVVLRAQTRFVASCVQCVECAITFSATDRIGPAFRGISMSYTVQNSRRLLSLAAAVLITFTLQGLVLHGFDQLASESQTTAALSQAGTAVAQARA